MQRISSLIHLSLFWAGVMSAVELVPEHQTVIVSVGDPATLKCSVKGEAISNYYINWYRKTQERQPHTKPSVFVMKNGTNVACLVKDFYPKDIRINLESSKKITEFDPAIVVSPSGKYNAVKLGQYADSNSVTCSVQHNKEVVYSTDFEVKTNSTDHLKPTETENTKQPSKSCHEPKVHAEKVNMMSLTVLGLRMLFAKSVAINFLLTAKLLFL
uniref:Ig-like domain-containing protein n=1 Tax=Macaca mulatta TaxID=9544 RepID=A0A5F7ZTD5_MACMU